MKRLLLVAVIGLFALLVGCANHEVPHYLWIGYQASYGDPDKKEPFTANNNLGEEKWTWYNEGENSVRAQVIFIWKKNSRNVIEWSAEETVVPK
jgi:hypothetical protein